MFKNIKLSLYSGVHALSLTLVRLKNSSFFGTYYRISHAPDSTIIVIVDKRYKYN